MKCASTAHCNTEHFIYIPSSKSLENSVLLSAQAQSIEFSTPLRKNSDTCSRTCSSRKSAALISTQSFNDCDPFHKLKMSFCSFSRGEKYRDHFDAGNLF